MKILFGVPDLTHRELTDLEIDGIRALKFECHTINYGAASSKSSYMKKIATTLSNGFLISKTLKKEKYDLLFLNTAFDSLAIIRDCITLFILKRNKVKIFLKIHGTDVVFLNKLKGLNKTMVNWMIKRVDGVGVLSNDERKAYLAKGYPSTKIFVIKNPINPNLYVKDSAFKKSQKLASSIFSFIFCSRFIPSKGLLKVLEAMKIVSSRFKTIHLFCIGSGPEMNKAQQFVDENKLNDYVTFTGFVPESRTRDFYSNGDALVFPTNHQEGFPMVVFQALAAGMPIITTRIRAAADYLNEPENVLWVKYDDHVQIAESMIRLLQDQALVGRMKDNNLTKAYQFTTEKNALEYTNIFKDIIQK